MLCQSAIDRRMGCVGRAGDLEELAAVQDAYSRRIVGWSMADHMRSELVIDALEMAVERRRPAPGLIHHSDQGSQHVSLTFGQAARDAGIARSMGSKGDCYDSF
jgi:putative transposase